MLHCDPAVPVWGCSSLHHPTGKSESGPEPLPAPFLASQPAPALPGGDAGEHWEEPLGWMLLPPPSPQQPQPHPIDVNAFLLNSYKTEYKILESTIVIKENFNSAVSGHLVHPVKCLVLWFRLFFFPCFLGFLFFLWFFLRVSLPLFQFQVAASPRAEAAVVQTNSALTRLLSTRLWQSSSIVK